VSVTAGTIIHRTKTDLRLWFLAAFFMVADKRGLSALSLQRQIWVKRYDIAWTMLHKLRRQRPMPTAASSKATSR
jgi:hypothetical protein